jgi:hypothetical protein
MRFKKAFLIGRTPVYFFFVNFDAPGSGSAFPIRIRILDSHMNADLDPEVRGMDPWIRIHTEMSWIHTEMSWIRNTAIF